MNRFFALFVVLFFLSGFSALACTNLIAGKDATTDGSVLVTYAADSYTRYGDLVHFPAASHRPGSMRQITRWGSYEHLGEIPEAPVTYNVVGNINEHQVCIGETTWGGRKELADSTGQSILDYGSLLYIALQRSTSAREAIDVITSLADEYGYASTGETLTIADKNEVWVMEIIGKGAEKGAVWIAVRIPDNAICAHANEPRIRKVDLRDSKNVRYAKDMISFARRRGYFSGKDEDFSFADAYCVHAPSMRRSCDARVWTFFRRFNKDMDRYLDWCLANNDDPMPLYVIPDRKLSVDDMKECMRDHYDGTPLDMTKDLGAGPYNSPYRWRPMRYEIDGETYAFERPISTQQTGWSFVAQCRSWLPDAVGGVLWFGTDDTNTTVYMPFYCSMTQVPHELRQGLYDINTFAFDSNFWMNNWVANQVYPRYSLMIVDVRRVQGELEGKFAASRPAMDSHLLALMANGQTDRIYDVINADGAAMAKEATDRYRELAQYLLVRYMDGAQKRLDDNGDFMRTPQGYPHAPASPGYPEEHYRRIISDRDGFGRLPK